MTAIAERTAGLAALRSQLERCLERHRDGSLAAEELRQALLLVQALGPVRQDLLYIQAMNTHPGSQALGLSMVLGGVAQEPPLDPARWPYQSPLEALQDGWRIIVFPSPVQVIGSEASRGLGCEFILERWSQA